MADSAEVSPLHKLQLTRGAVQIIEVTLIQPGVFKEPHKLFRAGQLAENVNADYGKDKPPKASDYSNDEAAYEAAYEKWSGREVALTVTEREREVLKECIKHHATQGALTATKHTVKLLGALGLSEE